MPQPDDLNQVQRWMQSVITNADGVIEGMAAPDAQQWLTVDPQGAEAVIGRSQALSALERLDIYAQAYRARLVECLRAQFPMLVRAVGEDLFDAFAEGYLEHHPSQSYSLGPLGARFAQFLAETRPSPEEAGEWPDFLIDLAILEWTFGEVFDGPGVEGQALLSAEELLAVPPERLPELRLAPVPCLRLLELSYPVHEYYSELRKTAEAAPPTPRPTRLAITRRDFVVRRHELMPAEHGLLAALVAGATLGEGISQAAALHEADLDTFAGQLQGWFQRWAAEGFFLRLA